MIRGMNYDRQGSHTSLFSQAAKIPFDAGSKNQRKPNKNRVFNRSVNVMNITGGLVKNIYF